MISMDTISTIAISVLSSSLISVLMSTLILEPIKEKNKYIFDEKKRVYESIIIFAQIILFPVEAKYSLGVTRYNIQAISAEESVCNAINDLKMSIPKLKLITKNKRVIESTLNFIKKKDQQSLDILTDVLRNDLFK